MQGMVNTQRSNHSAATQSLQSSQLNQKFIQAAQKLQQNAEDKENKVKPNGMAVVPGTVQSTSNLLKRSKTSDPQRAPLRQKETV